MKIDVWHNVMWSRYKAAVFSELYAIAQQQSVDLSIYQIAETESSRVSLSGVDLSRHKYPYVCLFKGIYSDVSLWKRIIALSRVVAATTADLTILAGYSNIEYWAQALILKARRKKFAIFCDSTIYDNPQKFWKGLAKRLFFHLADGAFCYGTRSKDYLMHYGMTAGKIHHRCQAAEIPDHYNTEQVLADRIAARAADDSPRLLYVGRISPEKRIDTLLRAFARILPQRPSARLVIVGKGPDEQTLQQLARQLGISGAVDFTGAKHDDALWAEYLNATCLVLPSWSEPWGLVVNEALLFGCPVIVSDRCGCVPQIVIEGKTGFSFRCDDIIELSAKLLLLIDSFTDTATVALNCIEHIATYTPRNAATAILDGAIEMVASP